MLTPTEIQAIMDDVDAGTFDLEDALNDIATKQRGEDVRRAMYGGILLVNHEGKAGAVDVKARQKMDLLKTDVGKQIEALQKQMGAFIANNSGTVQATKITETTLFSASTPSKAETLTVSDDVNNYDYIDIRYAVFGRTGIARFNPSDLTSTVHWTDFEAIYEVDYETGATPIRKVTFALTRIDADTLSSEIRAWRWSGKADDVGVMSSAGSSWTVGIYRIVGVKYDAVDATEKDAELTDLRIGYDDTEYDSAGEAVRAQIQALWEAVNSINIAAVTIDENGYLRFDDGGE